ncbi:hypothetical protein LL972_06640 [Xanthomonas campestris pv. asclepiadis]|uniref:hypothetical protein n=1 Tax=Xanthomonas campestris TaxID=339 RepID=UPI001E49CCC8|nr:hypothetical protein [Xanthomonas campestris]MCC4615688.1 hypothetical protein [Xanthomonas campestris pv. asclepiadis]
MPSNNAAATIVVDTLCGEGDACADACMLSVAILAVVHPPIQVRPAPASGTAAISALLCRKTAAPAVCTQSVEDAAADVQHAGQDSVYGPLIDCIGLHSPRFHDGRAMFATVFEEFLPCVKALH